MNLKIISAGAGSGKTYSLTQEMSKLLSPNGDKLAEVRASGIIATTFTNKAAAELKERVRVTLLEKGLTREADELGNAMIGTVHSIGVQLLKRFAFEAGVSPDVDIIADSDQQIMFNQSLSSVLSMELINEMEFLSEQLGFNKSYDSNRDWRTDTRNLTDIARANNFGVDILEASKQYSLDSFFELLPEVSKKTPAAFNEELLGHLERTLDALDNNEDGTKGKETLMTTLKGMKNTLKSKGYLHWYDWAKLTKLDAPKNSRDDIFDLVEFAQSHERHPDFHNHIRRYVSHIFDTSIAALKEYENYKKVRGLIDYIDMEVLILRLLENDLVRQVLSQEIDLLLVDEFQDTNPIQLKIFLKLTKIANQSIWVGDPKQSIYGFRGAAPDLMKAVMDSTDNIANLPDSWRSREDLVNLCNGLFTKAFEGQIHPDRIALKTAEDFIKTKESKELKTAAHHWHFQFEGNRAPAKPWFEQSIARTISEVLEQGWMIRKKGTNEIRPIQAGDIAVLCKTNENCNTVAEGLHREGIKASISRNGLLQTAEAMLVLACLRYIMNKHDALAIAEILLLSQKHQIEDIIVHRLEYLERAKAEIEEEKDKSERLERWGHDNPFIQQLKMFRHKSKELSATEILNGLVEKMDIRRTVAAWSNEQQRLDNIDALRKLAADYEETCNRLHSAATLGGFLLWLDDLSKQKTDFQGTGAGINAVNVMTYHKSKGLEWPFVVCHNLDSDLKDKIWGIRIIRQKPEIDIENPLANRLLCYWINPYADQIQKTALMERVDIHPAKQEAQKEALAEEVRLMYVGLTRARDYLVFPSMAKKPTKWLNRVFHNGNDLVPSLDLNSNAMLWVWNGEEIPLQTKVFHYELSMGRTEKEVKSIDYLPTRAGVKDYQPVILETAQMIFANLDYKLGAAQKFANRFAIPEKEEQPVVEYQILQTIFNTFIQADNPELPLEIRQKVAQNLLEQHQLSDNIKTKDLVLYSTNFYKKLQEQFKIKKIDKFLNFKYSVDGKSFYNGLIDMALVTEANELVLLLHLNQEIPKLSNNKNKVKEEVSILEAAARALSSVYQTDTALLYLVQSLEGVMTVVGVEQKTKQTALF